MKKHLLLVLSFAILISTVSYAQPGGSSFMFKHHSGIESFNTADMALSSPTLLRPSQMETYHYKEWKISSDGTIATYKPYMRAKSTRNTGIGLLASGGALMIIGSAMMADGIISIRRNGGIFGNDDGSNLGHLLETYFGAVFGVIGISLAIPGAVVLPRGLNKMKRVRRQWSEEHAGQP